METKQLITYVGIAAVAYYIYTQYVAPATAAVAAAPGTTPASSTAPVSPTSPAAPTQTTVTQASGTAYVPSVPSAPITRVPPINATMDSTFGSADFGSSGWVNRVAVAMTAAAGAQPQNADNWSWYYQNSAGGSAIDPSLMGVVLTKTGVDRSSTMGVTNFLQALAAAVNDSGNSMSVNPLMATATSGGGNLMGLGSFWGWVN